MADEKIELRIHELTATDRFEAIRELVKPLAAKGGLDAAAAARIEADILDRERLTPTAIGHGVAIPHARVESVDHVQVVLGRSAGGIPWEAPDGQPVRLVFQFISPKIGIQIHTDMLARIARVAGEREPDSLTVSSLTSNELWELLDDSPGDP